jgi:hypothetical protein
MSAHLKSGVPRRKPKAVPAIVIDSDPAVEARLLLVQVGRFSVRESAEAAKLRIVDCKSKLDRAVRLVLSELNASD